MCYVKNVDEIGPRQGKWPKGEEAYTQQRSIQAEFDDDVKNFRMPQNLWR